MNTPHPFNSLPDGWPLTASFAALFALSLFVASQSKAKLWKGTLPDAV